MKKIRPHLTYANVVATLSLFLVVAGGSAFAATQLAKNSVGSKQLKKDAVTAVKIKRGAITPAKLSSSSRSELIGPRGAQGPKGEQGAPGSFPATLPTGKTIVGTFDMEGIAAAANGLVTSEISYVFYLVHTFAINAVEDSGVNPFDGPSSVLVTVALALPIAMIGSYVVHRIVELPFIAIGRRLGHRDASQMHSVS